MVLRNLLTNAPRFVSAAPIFFFARSQLQLPNTTSLSRCFAPNVSFSSTIHITLPFMIDIFLYVLVTTMSLNYHAPPSDSSIFSSSCWSTDRITC